MVRCFFKKNNISKKKIKCNLVTLKEISTLHTPIGLVIEKYFLFETKFH